MFTTFREAEVPDRELAPALQRRQTPLLAGGSSATPMNCAERRSGAQNHHRLGVLVTFRGRAGTFFDKEYQRLAHLGGHLDVIFRLLMERWTLSILYALKNGPLHVGELQRIVGVSERMLSVRERTLTNAGLVRREDSFHTIPGGGGFRLKLTERGHELDDVLNQLAEISGLWEAKKVKKSKRG